MWRQLVAWLLGFILAGFVVCYLAAATPRFVPLLFLLPLFWAERLPSWDDELKAWLEAK